MSGPVLRDEVHRLSLLDKHGAVIYAHVNTTPGSFCVIDVAIVLCMNDFAGLYFPLNAVKEQQFMTDKQRKEENIDK